MGRKNNLNLDSEHRAVKIRCVHYKVNCAAKPAALESDSEALNLNHDQKLYRSTEQILDTVHLHLHRGVTFKDNFYHTHTHTQSENNRLC